MKRSCRDASRRFLAFFLAFAMMFQASPMMALASGVENDGDVKEQELKQELAEGSDEHPSGLLGFYATQILGTEGEDQELVVVRRGGTQGEASVELRALDVSAVYGKDYLMTVEEGVLGSRTLEGTSDGSTLMEEYADSLTVKEETPELPESNPASGQATQTALESGKASGLAAAKQAQTGVLPVQPTWRELNSEQVDENAADQMLRQGEDFVRQMAEEKASVSYTVHFADGEYEKKIRLSLIDDELSESQEQTAFVLSSAEGAEIDSTYTAYLNIADNDEAQEAVFAMAQKEVVADRASGEAKVVVRRTQGTDQMSVVTVGTSAGTAQADVDYVSDKQDIVFPAGMTEREVTVKLLDSGKDEEASFYVGIASEDGTVDADANATLVKIGKSVKESGAAQTSMVSTANSVSKYPIDGKTVPSARVSNTQNGCSACYKCGTWDLSLASEMKITYVSDEGSYTYEEDCDDITDRSREVVLSAFVNGKEIFFYDYSKGGNIGETTVTVSMNDMKKSGINKKDVTLGFRVKTRNKNRNATVKVKKWEIVYPYYTFSVVNTSGKDWPNTYVERIYTAAGSQTSKKDRYSGVSREGTTIVLGQGFVNGQGSAAVSASTDRLEFSYQLFQNNKNSIGVTVHPWRVNFLGWQLHSNKNSSQWSSTLSSIKFDGDFLNKYSDYILSGNRFEVRPVFGVTGTNTRFRNESPNKGQYTNYPNDSYINMTALDTVEVTAAAKTGFSVSGFTVNGGETSNTNRRDQIKVTPNANCTLHLLYEEPSITVQADLKGNNTSKGSVFYSDYSDPQKPVELSGDKNKVMTVKPVSLDQQYRIVGLPQEGWLTYWRDGTLDGVVGAPDGAIDEKEVAAYREYNSFSPVSGNVLAYVPTLSFAKIYYDFYPVTKIENPMPIEGRVYLKQREIFTGKTTTTGIEDGATVTCGEVSDTTYTEPATRRQTGGPGYFYLTDDTFGVYSYHLVTVSYAGKNGGTVHASAVCTPGSFKELTIDANDRMWVESTAATARIYEVTKENGKESLRLIEDLSGVNNGDATFRLAIKVEHIPSVVPTQAILRFYSADGIPYNDATVTANIDNNQGGMVNLDFNPKDLGLPAGTRLTLQFVDQNGKKSLEQETGIKLVKAIGVLDLVNSFQFGGAKTAIKIIGNINSSFNLGWNGDFDRSDAVTASERDGLKMRTVSLGFATSGIEKEKELAGLSKVAGDKTENDENLANLKKDLAKETNPKKKTQLQSEVTAAESEKAVSDAAYDQALANAADPHKTQTTMAAGASVDVGFKFAMSFALDEETSSWYFHDMMVYAEVAGGAGMDINFATPIGITINLEFGVGGDGSALFVVEERKDLDNPKRYYLTDLATGDDSNKINIFDFNNNNRDRAFDASGTFEVNPYIFLKAGAGFGGVVEVSVKGTAQFYMTFFTDDRDNTGSVTLEAAIGVKVLFIGGEWPFASTDISLFDDSASVLEPLEKENYLYESSDMLTALDRPYLENQGAFNGEGVMSAMSVQEDGAGVDTSVLQEGVYGSLHTKMMRLDGNKILAVYLNDDGSRSAENAAAAYYMLYDGKEWSDPALLENDGTLDQAPVIEDLGDHGVLVAWSTADKVFTANTSGVDMQNSLDIHAVIFDKKTGTHGDVMHVTEKTDEDNVADVNPNVSCSGDKMIVYYTKNEYAVSNEAAGEVIGDVIHPAESLMAYRIYDFKTQTWKTEYTEAEKAEIMENMQLDESGFTAYQNNWYGQVFLNTAPGIYIDEELDEEGHWTENPTIYDGYTVTKGEIEENEVGEDTTKVTGTNEPVESQMEPKIIDSDCITYNNISIFAYVIDYDNDLKTVNDRDIYMQLYDFEEDTFSHPIMVTADDVQDANVRFLRQDTGDGEYHSTYLAYLSGGNVKMINVSTLVKHDQEKESPSLLKNNKNGVEYYYINKAADSQYYEPPMTMVEGAVKEDGSAASDTETDEVTGEEEACAVTGFDVQTQGKDVYLVWTQNKFTLADGVEEGTPEASEAENQKVETQIYAMRYDGEESSDPVQITEGNGLNYGNVAFVAGDDGSMKMLASCTESTLETYEEFKASAEEFNKTAAEEDKVKIPAEEDYVPYAKEDESTTSLVSLDVKCNEACLAVEDIEPMDLASGQDNSISFKIVNEGLANIEDVTVTVEDEQGRAQLVESSVFEQDDPDTEGGKIETQRTETVESIRIPSMRGGETWNGTALYTLAEDETDVAFTVKVKSGDKTVAEQTFTDSIKDSIGVSDFTVEETDVRNQFVLKATVDNLADRISEENTVEFTLKDQKIAEVAVPKLEQGQSVELETEVTVDSKNLFVTEDVRDKDAKLLGKTSTGNFKAAVDGSELEETVERYVSADAYSYIEGIQAAMINDGKPITVKEGEYKKVDMNIKSSLDETLKKYVGADGSVMTGTAGLQVIWVSDDESIVTPYQNGSIEAKAAGTTTLYAYVMPKNEEVLAEGTEEAEETPGTFTEVSNYTKLPDEAIRVYSTTVTVSKAGAAVDTPPALPKVGTDVTSGGQTYVVTKAAAAQKEVSYKGTVNKKAKSVVIPATIQIGTDAYKVTAVKNDAFKNNKSLQKVTIGSNVASIGKNAFKGCVKLTKVTFKGSALKKVGASAFEGCKKLKKLTVPKSVKTIGKKAYYGCTALRKVTFKTKQKTKIGKNAFGKTHKKATFTVPKKYLKAYKKSLKKAKIGKKAKVKGR